MQAYGRDATACENTTRSDLSLGCTSTGDLELGYSLGDSDVDVGIH